MDIAEAEHYMDEAAPGRNYTVADSDESSSNGFDCNICLDSVQDPVVTFCGHLYCWPCIYKWLHFQTISTEHKDMVPQHQCPVCKAEVSEDTLVPLFGRGQTAKHSKTKVPNLGVIIPRRPLGIACGFNSPRSHLSHSGNYSASTMLAPRVSPGNMFDPVIGMFGEMIYARVFGNSITNIYGNPNSYNLAGSTSPRLRRHVMQAEESLGRICFFVFCCVCLCFLSF